MIEEIKELIKNTGLNKLFSDIKEEIEQGKPIEIDIEPISYSLREESLFEGKSYRSRKKKTERFIQYEKYTSEEKNELIIQTLTSGALDTLDCIHKLSEFCETNNVSIKFENVEQTIDSKVSLGEFYDEYNELINLEKELKVANNEY